MAKLNAGSRGTGLTSGISSHSGHSGRGQPAVHSGQSALLRLDEQLNGIIFCQLHALFLLLCNIKGLSTAKGWGEGWVEDMQLPMTVKCL